ncbi:MAG: hypothetical protein GXP25_15185 [Planctomycetes bacterium]|nr:hypothetical protein [Planctomycetota bacterium]
MIRKAAKCKKALIYWADEMGVRSDHQADCSYASKGQTPVISGTGQRFGCNILSAVTRRGHLDFMVFKKRFQASIFLRFLRRLTKQARPQPSSAMRHVRRYLERRRANPELVQRDFYEPSVRYAALGNIEQYAT